MQYENEESKNYNQNKLCLMFVHLIIHSTTTIMIYFDIMLLAAPINLMKKLIKHLGQISKPKSVKCPISLH